MAELTEALERTAATPAQRNVLDALELYTPHLSKLLGSDQAAERFKVEVRGYIRTSPALLDCDPVTIAGGALWAAQLGLSLGPLGLFYLIPFGKRAVPVVGYKGYCALAYASGQVKELRANLVYKSEAFKEWGGSTPRLVHEIDHSIDQDEKPIAAYAMAKLKSGGTVWHVVKERDWERARIASPLGKEGKGLWKDHFPEAVRKTAIRRLADKGELPLMPTMAQALTGDEETHDAPALVDTQDVLPDD